MADDGCGEIVLEKPAFVLLRFQNMRRPTARFTLPMTPKHTRDTIPVLMAELELVMLCFVV